MILHRDDSPRQTVVPDYRELSADTLRRIIRDARLTVDEFFELL